MKTSVVFIILIAMFTSTAVKAAEVPRESAPCNAKPEAIITLLCLGGKKKVLIPEQQTELIYYLIC